MTIGSGKQKQLREDLLHCQLVYHEFHMKLPVIEPEAAR
jgi:hypothetical protein